MHSEEAQAQTEVSTCDGVSYPVTSKRTDIIP